MPKSDQVSRIEFFCDDRRVGEALRALVGLAIGRPDVQPVTNAKKKLNGGGDTSLAAETSGKIVDQFAAYLAEAKPTELRSADMRQFMTSIGRSPASAAYLAEQAVKAKLIKKHPKAGQTIGHWVVLRAR